MSEQLPDGPDGPDEGHPVVTGLMALVGVSLAVGLIVGFVVLAGTQVLGIGGGGDGGGSTSERSMYLPRPEKTPPATGPEITLAPGASTPASSRRSPSEDPTASKTPKKQISLSASATTAGPMETFNLTGVYPGGEGAILQVQRFQAGSWSDFNATGSVSDETFQIPIQTSQPGVNRFRVVDTDGGMESNEVRITIG